MFDTLTGKLQSVFKNLRGLGKISDSNISDSLREVRMALLEADVNFKVARDFIERVKEKALGQEVILSIQPGQQIIKIIHDELVTLLGSANAGMELSGNPSCVLIIGLHGSGKTTSSGKLARLLLKQGRLPLLVAAGVDDQSLDVDVESPNQGFTPEDVSLAKVMLEHWTEEDLVQALRASDEYREKHR